MEKDPQSRRALVVSMVETFFLLVGGKDHMQSWVHLVRTSKLVIR